MKNSKEIIKMKKNTVLIFASFLIFCSANAQPEEWCDQNFCCYQDNSNCHDRNFYATISGGVNFLQNTRINGNKTTYQTGYIVGGAFGYHWCNGFSVEGEYAYRKNNISNIHFFQQGSSKSGHLHTSSLMANLLWNMPLSSWGMTWCGIQPYIGAGIGYDRQCMHSSNSRVVFNQKWNHFSWQVMAGLSYPIFCDTDLIFDYKFHQGGCDFNNHAFVIGLTYRFDFSQFGLKSN